MILLILLNSTIFLLLSIIHIYWASGGKWARNAAVPADRKGKRVFRPRPASTLMIAAALFFFALITIANVAAFNNLVDSRIIHYGNWTIGIIFLLRAIGDFNYFGFAKRIRHTDFALYDTRIYSPLALGIATISFVIIFWN